MSRQDFNVTALLYSVPTSKNGITESQETIEQLVDVANVSKRLYNDSYKNHKLGFLFFFYIFFFLQKCEIIQTFEVKM